MIHHFLMVLFSWPEWSKIVSLNDRQPRWILGFDLPSEWLSFNGSEDILGEVIEKMAGVNLMYTSPKSRANGLGLEKCAIGGDAFEHEVTLC